ncbi:MAG: type II toxin-antitoxin system VapC family toxin [Candidatus Dormibacteria bacterium]
MNDVAVVDASALVELLLGTAHGSRVSAAFGRFAALHAPAHLDAEVLSALGRLHRAGRLKPGEVRRRLEMLSDAPIERHPLASLVTGAWSRRDRLRLVDALYVELSDRLGAALLTTDARLATAAGIEAISL